MRTLNWLLVVLAMLSMLSMLVPSNLVVRAQEPQGGEEVLEREPDWNLEIFPFADHNENNIWDPDSNEDFVRSYGRITYTASGTGRNWEARELPAQIRIPHSVAFRIDATAVSYNVYNCQTVYRTMLDSGRAYVEVPCHSRNWFEWVHHVWIGFITGE